MKNLSRLLSSLLFSGAVLLTGCDKDQNKIQPVSIDSMQLSAITTPVVTMVGPYVVTYTGSSLTPASTTFNYEIQMPVRTTASGMSHIIFQLANCTDGTAASYSDLDGPFITITSPNNTSVSYTLSDSEGSGTKCFTDSEGNPISKSDGSFVKLDGLGDDMTGGGIYKVALVLKGAWGVSDGTIWLKYGNNCEKGAIPGPGCKTILTSCSFSQGYYFANPFAMWINATTGEKNASVTVGGTTLDKALGQTLWGTYPGGTNPYTAALYQAATIKLSTLSGDYVPSGSAVDMAVSRIDNLMSSLSITGISSVPVAVTKKTNLSPSEIAQRDRETQLKQAAGLIGAWISLPINHCPDQTPQ